MRSLIYYLFLWSCVLYVPAILFAAIGWKRLRNVFFVLGVGLMSSSCIVRVYYNWSLMGLFQEPYLISLFAAIITLYLYLHAEEEDKTYPDIGVHQEGLK